MIFLPKQKRIFNFILLLNQKLSRSSFAIFVPYTFQFLLLFSFLMCLCVCVCVFVSVGVGVGVREMQKAN